MSRPATVHASCVLVEGAGFLLLGASGAGKSDLALRLIDRGARLVADDRVVLEAREGTLWASPPTPLAGLLEVRGLGLVTLDHLPEARLHGAVHLGSPCDRLPEPAHWSWGGVRLPAWRLAPFEPSAAAKLILLARVLAGTLSLDPPPSEALESPS